MTAPTARVVHVRDGVPDAVYVGRAMPRQGLKASPLANPYKIGRDGDRATVIGLYTRRLDDLVALGNPVIVEALIACRGRPLACWCRHDGEEPPPENACHAAALLDFLARHTDDELRRK